MRKLSQNKAKKKQTRHSPSFGSTHPGRMQEKKMQNKRNEKWYKTTDAKQSEEKNKIVPINGAEKTKTEQQMIDVEIAKWGEK